MDTSVLSHTRKGTPASEVVRWWQSHDIASMAISSMTVHEIRHGIELAPAGMKRDALETWFQDFVLKQFANRILPVDTAIADRSARLVVAARRASHTAELADALIAATALVHGLRMATLNRKHFEQLGVNLVDF